VLLVFQLGQTRIFYSMSRDGLLPFIFQKIHPKYGTPFVVTIVTGILVAVGSSIFDDDETYDLTNIGTLFAFFVVCVGVLVLRVKDPDRPRPFRVPAVWLVAPLGAAACVFVMTGLPVIAWVRFGVWMAFGMAFYFVYGFWHSRLRTPPPAR
jgi:basic amino acid/polyamine antiporter, APA family